MDLYQLLKHDHQKILRLFERLDAAAGSAETTQARLFAELKRELELHTDIEEKYFYPALKDRQEAKELVAEAYEDHDAVKKILGDLGEAGVEGENWAAQLGELREDVEFHVETEETEIFPLAHKLLDISEVEGIVRAIEREKESQKTR